MKAHRHWRGISAGSRQALINPKSLKARQRILSLRYTENLTWVSQTIPTWWGKSGVRKEKRGQRSRKRERGFWRPLWFALLTKLTNSSRAARPTVHLTEDRDNVCVCVCMRRRMWGWGRNSQYRNNRQVQSGHKKDEVWNFTANRFCFSDTNMHY